MAPFSSTIYLTVLSQLSMFDSRNVRKHSRHLVTAVIAIVAAASIAPLSAQPIVDSSARALLDRYVADAIRANLALAQQRTHVDRVRAELRETNARALPSLDFNARYSETSGVINIGDFINPAYSALNQLIGQSRFPTNINATLPLKQETKLELSMPLYNASLNAARAAARAQRDLVGVGARAATRQLAADVQLAWLGFASLTQAVVALEATMPLLDENARASARLIDAGQATPDALLRANAERSDVQQQLEDARRQRDAARRGFNLLRDQDGDAPIAIASDSSLLRTDSMTITQLVAHALAHREELQQSATGIRLANAQQRAARAGYLPSVGMSASYGIQGNQYRVSSHDDVALANIVLSWNAFSGGQTHARQEQANAVHAEAELRAREVERAVRLQVANAYDAVQSARSSLRSADDRNTSAQRALVLVQRRYAEGLASHVEFVSARTAATSAAINQIITRFTFASRVVELERAAALRTLPE